MMVYAPRGRKPVCAKISSRKADGTRNLLGYMPCLSIIEWSKYPKNFSLLSVEDMCCETSVCSKPLPCHRICYPGFSFGHVPNVIPLRIHDNISVCLFKPTPTRKLS